MARELDEVPEQKQTPRPRPQLTVNTVAPRPREREEQQREQSGEQAGRGRGRRGTKVTAQTNGQLSPRPSRELSPPKMSQPKGSVD